MLIVYIKQGALQLLASSPLSAEAKLLASQTHDSNVLNIHEVITDANIV